MEKSRLAQFGRTVPTEETSLAGPPPRIPAIRAGASPVTGRRVSELPSRSIPRPRSIQARAARRGVLEPDVEYLPKPFTPVTLSVRAVARVSIHAPHAGGDRGFP